MWDLKNVTELTGKIVVIRPEWSGRKKLEEGWIKDVKVHLARKSLNVLQHSRVTIVSNNVLDGIFKLSRSAPWFIAHEMINI